MPVLNIHVRELPVPCDAVGALIDTLASPDDRLWPSGRWPVICLDRGLSIGSHGGHGPIRYTVVAYQPRHWVRLRFTGPRGFDGFHEFTVEPVDATHARLTHLLAMRPRRVARVSWPLLYRPLHDALIEDALENAQQALTGHARTAHWSLRVRGLRRLGRIIASRTTSR